MVKTSIPILNVLADSLDAENVLTDTDSISAYQTATFITSQQVLAVLKPGDATQVQACVKVANQHKTPIYPISGGKNWGLGSRVPVQNNCIILDLSRLNRILDFNEKLAYITVEPGVTFQQVYEFLRQQNSNLFLSVIGGSPDASLIGNLLERGDGIGPYGERATHVCGFEVILPTGEFIHTGFGRFANASATPVSRWGVGPASEGLFTQSNLGIVTKMTFWLRPLPQFFQVFTCSIPDVAYLSGLLDTIQPLMLQEIIQGNCCSVWNSYKVFARQGRYPWKIMDGKTPLHLKELKRFERWFASGAIYSASREQGLAQRQIIEQALAGKVEELVFADDDSNPELREDNLYLGVPSNQNVKSTYWRKKSPIPAQLDPDRDRCGTLWLCLVFPFDGVVISPAVETIEVIIKQYQFEPNLAFNCNSGRSIHLFIAIMFDREVAGEDEKAMSCHDELLQMLTQAGHIPYRLGIQSMNSLPPAQDDYGFFLRTLKQALDPNDILAPGRYDFKNDWK
ncbi:FAD-binding oxidoreductase [Microcoleus sp. T2B6]|uniref:FAD-binding oxidoreductase n=1 Tax=Microcoleus sp. T2B6 TaxID=3055424 RepID=UPI002FD0BBF8